MTALEDVADELYGLPPQEFVAAREQHVRRVRAEGDRDLATGIQRLARPSAAAWLVNMLPRHRADELEQVLRLGEELRKAQSTLDGAQLRALDKQRRELTRAVTVHARMLAEELGNRVSEAAATQVQETLQAAMADPAAAAAVRQGRLVAPLSPAGFGPVDLSGALSPGLGPGPAPTARGTRPRADRTAGAVGRSSPAGSGEPEEAEEGRDTGGAGGRARTREERRRRLERALRDARGQLDGARQRLGQADEELAEADAAARAAEELTGRLERELEDLKERLRVLEHRLVEAGHDAADARRDLRTAGRRRDRAEQDHRQAGEAVEEAEAELEAAGPGAGD